MKIYFFGGSFDPPHRAHKLIYKHCLDFCDKFIFFPAKCSPGKLKSKTNVEDRLNMLDLLIDKEDSYKVSIDNFELNNDKEKSYTINTIHYLRKKFKNASFSMIVGYDQYQNLHNWKDSDKILELVDCICFKRDTFKADNISSINFIDFNHHISSSLIKKEINNFAKLKKFLNKDVYEYIISKNLYKG